ncbi:MAG: hypothetical protein AB8B80_06695 [Marinicellaceae bacterium]
MIFSKIKFALIACMLMTTCAVNAINVNNDLFEGFWYESDSDAGRGWGFDYIRQGPEKGLMFVAGYVYDDAGNPFWVTGITEVLAGESILDFDLLTVTNGSFTEASTRTNNAFASMTVNFNNCQSMSVDITGIDSDLVAATSVSYNLTPFDAITGFPRNASSCPYQTSFTSCPDFASTSTQAKTCILSGTLTGNKTLTNDTNWVLQGPVFVGVDGGTQGNLTIEPGTRVLGVTGNDFLAVQRGSQIFAEGTANAPIVFTGPFNASDPSAGAGNWGGLVISGKAPLNICDESVPFDQCEDVGEGASGNFGGDQPHDSSGVLKYVRVQFGGFRINDEDELNGIAFQGVGDGTVVDYVQVHANEDDGVEFFGGTVNAKHLVLTNIKDDSLDWTHGWDGEVQYLLVKQDPDSLNDKERGIEADNYELNNDATPRSQPMIANATFIGAASDNKTTTGMVLRRGTGANFTNVIVTGFEKCLDIDSSATFAAAGSPANLTGGLTMENTVISCDFNYEEEEGDAFTVQSFFEAQTGNIVADPALMGIYPTAATPTNMSIDPEKWGAFFDKVNYVGAFKSQSQAWTNGWTEFLD